MLRWYKADLHIHTCLSPCGDLSMSPKNIISEALKKQIDIIAICDHNSAKNAEAVIGAAAGKELTVLPGMEVCTKEEIHVLAIFGEAENARKLQSLVYDRLHGENDPEIFGLQVLANGNDEFEGYEERLLIGAADLGVEEVTDEIHKLDGIAVASHIDRESYSVMSQLGFIPAELRFDALEISGNMSYELAREKFGSPGNRIFISNSDAHFIGDIGKSRSEYLLEEPTFPEIIRALRCEGDRKVLVP